MKKTYIKPASTARTIVVNKLLSGSPIIGVEEGTKTVLDAEGKTDFDDEYDW